jgi:hypothetical protein
MCRDAVEAEVATSRRRPKLAELKFQSAHEFLRAADHSKGVTTEPGTGTRGLIAADEGPISLPLAGG